MNDPRFCVLQSTYWSAHVMDDQLYLGRLVVVLNTPQNIRVEHLRDIPVISYVELLHVISVLEESLTKAFGATMFNWACLMNNAYQEPDPKPHVHWHFRPRYKQHVEFEGVIFEDPNFGHHYLREDNNRRLVGEEMKLKIANAIREAVFKVDRDFLPQFSNA
jgi:diadenosine tetraphosphate (Ap4A) HIT family hydrolase